MCYLVHPHCSCLWAGSWQHHIRTLSSLKAFPHRVCSAGLRACMTRRRKIPRRSSAQTAPGWCSASIQRPQTREHRSTESGQKEQYLKVFELRTCHWWMDSLNISLSNKGLGSFFYSKVLCRKKNYRSTSVRRNMKLKWKVKESHS